MLHWRRAFHSTLPTLDRDHAFLFRLFNRLEASGALRRQADQADANGLIDELLEYSVAHCAREEAAMREAGYPELERHAQGHACMRDCFIEILRALAAGEISLPTFARLVRGQFLKHFMKDDYPFAVWVRRQRPGYRPEAFQERRRMIRKVQPVRERRAVG